MTGLKPSDYRVGQSVEWDPGDGVWVPARVVVLHVEDDIRDESLGASFGGQVTAFFHSAQIGNWEELYSEVQRLRGLIKCPVR
jgi:hypothetical protein